MTFFSDVIASYAKFNVVYFSFSDNLSSFNFAVTMRLLQLISPNKASHLDLARKSTEIMCFSPIFRCSSLLINPFDSLQTNVFCAHLL